MLSRGGPLLIGGGVACPPAGRRSSQGGYFNARQQVAGEASDPDKRGSTLFFNAVVADHNTVATDWQFAVGAPYAGLFANQPHDALALGMRLAVIL